MISQAVGIRINKLIDESIIKRYSIDVDDEKMGISLTTIIKL